MREDYIIRKISRNAKFLDRWRGARAQLRELTAHHPSLSIVLTRDDTDGNLLIACLEPEEIRSPVVWKNANIGMEPAILPSGEVGVKITDAEQNVMIIAVGFEVAENVKLK